MYISKAEHTICLLREHDVLWHFGFVLTSRAKDLDTQDPYSRV